MIATRLVLIGVLAIAAWLALRYPEDSFVLAAATPALAAGGLFPALVLGIWWARATVAGAIAGVIAGFGVTAFYVLATRYGGLPLLRIVGLTEMGVSPLVAAVFGAPLGFVAMIVVSLVTPEPSEARRALVDALRRPGRDPGFEDVA